MRRQVDQAGAGIERHRMPVVRAVRAREWQSNGLSGERASGTSIGRPLASYPVAQFTSTKFFGRDELAGGAIEDEEEAVLRRLHQHLARLAVDRRGRPGSSAGSKCSPSCRRAFPGSARRICRYRRSARRSRRDRDCRRRPGCAGCGSTASRCRCRYRSVLSSGSKVMLSHAVPPPPFFQYLPPDPGLGGRCHRLVLEGLAGSPGTTKKRQACLPVSAS